jgi:hypothetical protein
LLCLTPSPIKRVSADFLAISPSRGSHSLPPLDHSLVQFAISVSLAYVFGIRPVRNSKMTWEESDKTIQSGHKNPQDYQKDTLKTITLNEKEGDQASQS